MQDLGRSPCFNFIVGSGWFLAAILMAIENPVFIGPVFWAPIILGMTGFGYFVYGIILTVKERHRNQKDDQ